MRRLRFKRKCISNLKNAPFKILLPRITNQYTEKPNEERKCCLLEESPKKKYSYFGKLWQLWDFSFNFHTKKSVHLSLFYLNGSSNSSPVVFLLAFIFVFVNFRPDRLTPFSKVSTLPFFHYVLFFESL